MGVHHHKAPIVTKDIVFHVDSANNISGNTPIVDPNVRNMTPTLEVSTGQNGVEVVDSKYSFDGTDDYIDVTSSAVSQDVALSGDFTVEVWAGLTPDILNDSTIYTLIDFIDGVSKGLSIHIRGGSYEGLLAQAGTTGTDQLDFSGGNVDTGLIYGSGKNNCFLVVRDGSEFKSYFNGVHQRTLTGIGGNDYTGGSSRRLGMSVFGKLKGTISSVKIYSEPLTTEKISQNYESQKHRFH